MLMESESNSDTQFKKRRGRPPRDGSKKGKQDAHRRDVDSHQARLQDASLAHSGSSTDDSIQTTGMADTPFSHFLQRLFQGNRAELARAARELDVSENTIYRWMNGSSIPRALYLKKLPEVFPDQRIQLTSLIRQVFGDVVGDLAPNLHETQKDIYMKVLELAASSQDKEARMWQVSQAIFEYALLHMDVERLGLSITYARLMQPQADGIHSLYEAMTRGNDSYPSTTEAAAFLGSTSLAGTTAVTQRLQMWSSADDKRSLVQIDEFEQSACAAPVLRNSLLAGVLLFSSTQPDFFKDPLIRQAVMEYALLMSIAPSDSEFYPPARLNLRPMPDLTWQRKQMTETYADRVIIYARRHAIARREAELEVLREMECDFEEEARKVLEQRQKALEEV